MLSRLPDDALGYDTETRGLRWMLPDQRAFLGTWADATETYVAPFVGESADPDRYVAAITAAPMLIAHNQKFDAHQTRETLGLDVFEMGKELHDTDLMSRILMPEGNRKSQGGHKLKHLSNVFLKGDADSHQKAIEQLAKDIGLRSLKRDGAFYDVWRAYPEEMERYARYDARYTRDLPGVFLPMFEKEQRLWDLYNLELNVQKVLYRAERLGTRVDPAAVKRMGDHYNALHAVAAKDCERELGFVPEGEGSQDKLEEALINAGVELTERTEHGKLSTAREALRPFEDHPAVEALFRFNRSQKFLSTYLAPMEGVEVVQPDFNQAEAWTGRMSCRRPNMQNLPKRSDLAPEDNLKLRSMFIPREDHYFVVADFEGVEMRILSHYLGVPWYREMVASGDPHAYTAATIWGGKPEEYGKTTKQRFLRDIAKHCTFAITYGAGAPRVRETINKMAPPEYRVDVNWVKNPANKYDSPPEARRIKETIISAIPGYNALAGRHGLIQSKIRSEGFVRTHLGRKQMVNPEKAYVGLNSLIQGTAADVMKLAAVELAKTQGTPLLFIHDEVLMEYHNDVDEKVAMAETVEAMQSCVTLKVPLSVEVATTRVSYAHV